MIPVGECNCGDARWGCTGLAGVARKPRQLTFACWLKFAFGLLLMACGFMLLAFDARHAAADGQASMGVMVSGLALMGFAELFIDPVAIAQITRLNVAY
ncbi:hypothetical protein ACLB1E_02320 [Escherichia coli]